MGSAAARREARRLVARSTGEPLNGAEASTLGEGLGADGATVHDDACAGRAALLLGAHAFTLGNRIFLGPTVGLPDGPSREEALRHELVHRAQGVLGARTGRIAPRPVSWRDRPTNRQKGAAWKANCWPRTRRKSTSGFGFRPSSPLATSCWTQTRPTPPAPMTGPTPRSPRDSGLARRCPWRCRWGCWAGRRACSAPPSWGAGLPGYTASGDLGQGRFSGVGVYAERGATGAVLWMIPIPPLRQYAAGATGARLFGSFAGSGATGGVTLRAMGDIGRGEISPLEDYLLWGGAGTGLGLLGAGGVRGLDLLATRGAVASDLFLSEALAARAPAGPAAVGAALDSAPWWGRASHGYLASRNWVIVYRGQGAVGGEILSPLARGPGGLAASEDMLAQLRAAGLAEEDIAGLTAKFGPEPVPASFLPPELQGLGSQPLGGAGIPVTRLPGVAADYASGSAAELAAQGLPANPVVLVIRAPAGTPVSALNTGWGSKSLVEQEYIVFHQIPGGYIVQRIGPGGLSHLRAGYDTAARQDVLELAVPGVPRVQ